MGYRLTAPIVIFNCKSRYDAIGINCPLGTNCCPFGLRVGDGGQSEVKEYLFLDAC